MLYAFNKLANWQRPAGGPLVIPTYDNPRIDESKESALDERWISYLRKLNPDKTAYRHLVSPDWGPTKGFNKNDKLRFIHLVYPGPGNVVQIDRVDGEWGLLRTLPMDRPPSLEYTNISNPHLIHKVYGSNAHRTAVLLEHAPYVPILGDSRWIEMKWLTRIDVISGGVACRLRVPIQWIYSDKSTQSNKNGILAYNSAVTVTGVAIGEHGLWGTVQGGWIPLRYRGSQMTNWKI